MECLAQMYEERKDDFYQHLNNAEKYICDRCGVAELRADEYSNNRTKTGIFCDECYSWIHLKKWKCFDCGSSGTIRSERNLYKKCQCGNIVELVQK